MLVLFWILVIFLCFYFILLYLYFFFWPVATQLLRWWKRTPWLKSRNLHQRQFKRKRKGPGLGKGRRTTGGNGLTTALVLIPALAGDAPAPGNFVVINHCGFFWLFKSHLSKLSCVKSKTSNSLNIEKLQFLSSPSLPYFRSYSPRRRQSPRRRMSPRRRSPPRRGPTGSRHRHRRSPVRRSVTAAYRRTIAISLTALVPQ